MRAGVPQAEARCMDHSYGSAYAEWQAELRAWARRPAARPASGDGDQAVTSNVAVSSAVELPPTQTSNVEGSRTQARSTAFQ